MDPTGYDFRLLAVHATGIILVVAMLRPLTRLVVGCYLCCWSAGWVCLAVSLGCLFASAQFPAVRMGFLVGYLIFESAFGILLWAGCDNLTTGRIYPGRYFSALVPWVLVSTVVAAVSPDLGYLFPIHSAFLGLILLISLTTVARHPPAIISHGLWLIWAAIFGLVVSYWHDATMAGLTGYRDPAFIAPFYGLWSLYDLFLEAALALGMAVYASEKVRAELERANRQLAAATEDLGRAVRTDPLTGVLNRRALDEMMAGPATGTTSGAVAVIDLNDFKLLNDSYGHAAGDVALQIMARALRSCFRAGDHVYRTGGDEFVIVLPAGHETELDHRLVRLGTTLAGLRLTENDIPVDVSIAWGVAGYATPCEIRAALDRADSRMYQHKKSGKTAELADSAAGPSHPVDGPLGSAAAGLAGPGELRGDLQPSLLASPLESSGSFPIWVSE